jgi:hypothetical protein
MTVTSAAGGTTATAPVASIAGGTTATAPVASIAGGNSAVAPVTSATGGNNAIASAASGGTTTATNVTSPTGGAPASTTETLDEVIKRFCRLEDVTRCDVDCYANRTLEANEFKSCRDLYKSLMLCQLSLATRSCEGGVVVSNKSCLGESNAYAKCLGLP